MLSVALVYGDGMTRSQSLAVGRLDGAGTVVILKPSDVAAILEALRYHGENTMEAGISRARDQRLITQFASLSNTPADLYRIA